MCRRFNQFVKSSIFYIYVYFKGNTKSKEGAEGHKGREKNPLDLIEPCVH